MPDPAPSTPALAFASAVTTEPQTAAAVDELLGQLPDHAASAGGMAVVFASMHHADGLARAAERIRQTTGIAALIGCTSEGAIGVRREVEAGPAMSILVGGFPGADVRVATMTPPELGAAALTEDPALVRALLPDSILEDLRAIVLLADPFSTPMIKLLPALNRAFGDVPVVGGMASGGRSAEQNRLIVDDEVVNMGAVALAIAGEVDVQTTVSQGCRPIGRPFVITRAKRHVVQELGGRNALAAVQEMAQDLPDKDRELLTTGGVYLGRVINEYRDRFGRGDFLIRNVIGVDPDSGYVAINDPLIRVGQTVQFHVRDAEAATQDLSMLLQAQRIHGPGAGALLFSCNSRGRKLFEKPDADADMVHEALGEVPLAGFFAAGEIGPIGERNFMHGHTASLMVFRPADPGPAIQNLHP